LPTRYQRYPCAAVLLPLSLKCAGSLLSFVQAHHHSDG
jgi:hypothetical protein